MILGCRIIISVHIKRSLFSYKIVRICLILDLHRDMKPLIWRTSSRVSQSAQQPLELYVVLLLQWSRLPVFPLEVFEMLITSPPLFSSPSVLQIPPPTTSGSWRLKCGSWRTITISCSHRWGTHIHICAFSHCVSAHDIWTCALAERLLCSSPIGPKHVKVAVMR